MNVEFTNNELETISKVFPKTINLLGKICLETADFSISISKLRKDDGIIEYMCLAYNPVTYERIDISLFSLKRMLLILDALQLDTTMSNAHA